MTWIIVPIRRVTSKLMLRCPTPLALAARTAQWPFAGSELNQHQAHTWSLSLPIARPLRVALAGWVVSLIAGASLGMAASMQGLAFWQAAWIAMMPLMLHGMSEWFRRDSGQGLSLLADPNGGWYLNRSGQTYPVNIRWGSRHLFGLTLSLRILHHPRHLAAKRTVTVWRWSVIPQDYRRLCVMYAWIIRQPVLPNPGETQ